MSYNKNPGLWIAILAAVVLWNLYEIFGPQTETPPQSIVILTWGLVACGIAGIVGAVMQLMKNSEKA
ncbi:MAG TPA: hypothetical protein VG651_06075 [Stellaceae bacterium]|nr:hypothetical protein [Stellaceae bacterium]